MIPFVNNILAWEKALEIQDQARKLREYNDLVADEISVPETNARPRQERLERALTWKQPQASCECS